jgi:hypothetical protein
MTARANHRYLDYWGVATASRSRHDYICPDHTLKEMMHEGYFDPVKDNLRVGDLLYVVDAEDKMATFRIAHIDRRARKVEFDVVERFEARPVIDAGNLSVRWRGPKGGKWCIMRGTDKDAEIVERDFDTREQAEHRMKEMAKAAA